MDPNTLLRELRTLYRAVLDNESDDTDETLVELAEKIDHLDSWMTRGGFSPWGTFTHAEGRGPAVAR